MDISKIILNGLKQRGEMKAADVVRWTGFSRAYINRFFRKLADEGKIRLIGKANRAVYVPAAECAVEKARKNILSVTRILQNKNLFEDIILDEIKKQTGIFSGLRKNISGILSYAFSEMLNNAIEHSRSGIIRVSMRRADDTVDFSIVDEGVGIYNNIMKKKRLSGELDAIQDLLKGRQTTAPEAHSGEGIFFTSKAGDLLVIQSSHKKLIFDNLLKDVFVKEIKNAKGTKVFFALSLGSKRSLDEIFRRYTDEFLEFSKTEVTVRMYKMDTEYISRSQARRITSGLEKFKTVTLDFKDVEVVGQAFADELFRVWQSSHPNIMIEVKNANENVNFMINRARVKQ